MEFLKGFFATVGVVIALAALTIGGREFALRMNSHYAPREEQVRHDTFECSASHTDGLAREVRQYMDQYRSADAGGREVLANRIKQEVDSYTCGDLPADVQSFRQSLN
jgi:hypothetical protein